MITSSVIVNNITVMYTNEQFLWQNYFTVDTGFFNLNYQSSLVIDNSSRLTNCRGAIAAVLYATGFSNVTIKGGSIIEQSVSGRSGSTIYFTMTN